MKATHNLWPRSKWARETRDEIRRLHGREPRDIRRPLTVSLVVTGEQLLAVADELGLKGPATTDDLGSYLSTCLVELAARRFGHG